MILLSSYYYKPHFGGIENSLYSLAKEYKERGDEVLILASDAGLNKSTRLPAYEVVDGINVIRFRHFIPIISIFYFFGPLYDIVSVWLTIKKLKTHYTISKVLVRHHIPALPLLFFKWERLIYLVPGVVKIQDRLPLTNKSTRIRTRLVNWYSYYFLISQQIFIQNTVFRKYKEIFVFSDNMKSQIVDSLKDPSILNKIKKVSPGVDLSRFSEGKNHRLAYRKEEGVPENSFVFLCIGRITFHKGFDLAIEAFSVLLEKLDKAKLTLLIIGDGPEWEKLLALIQQKKIEDHVCVKGMTTVPEKYYALSDAFIMPSRYEPFGQTIIEAMASELPVIAFHSGKQVVTATEQIVTDSMHGVLCDYSIEALADAMEKAFLWDEHQRQQIREACKHHIEKNYSWKTLAGQLFPRPARNN